MGMDVSGRNPKSKDGEYFRACVWSWRPIHGLMILANERGSGKLVTARTLDGMGYNDGHGLRAQRECDAMADALERLLSDRKALRKAGFLVTFDPGDQTEEMVLSFPPKAGMAVDARTGHFIKEDSARKRLAKGDKAVVSPYRVHESHALEFVGFLRACGGFQVF